MYLFFNGPMAIFLLFLIAAYTIWEHDKEAIRACVVIGLLLLLINYLGASWKMAPIFLGFVFAILLLFKIVYDV